MGAARQVHPGEEFSMSRTIRSASLVLVLSCLVASTAFAMPRATRPAPAPAALTAVWEWLTSLLTPASPVAKGSGAGIMTKAGSHMDPDGAPHASTIYSAPTTDAGNSMDPNGAK
jgi:hypothetical protein